MLKSLLKNFGYKRMRASIKTVISFQDVNAAVSFNFNHFYFRFVSFSTICALIPCWEFLIVCVINFLQAFEKNCLFAAYKTA